MSPDPFSAATGTTQVGTLYIEHFLFRMGVPCVITVMADQSDYVKAVRVTQALVGWEQEPSQKIFPYHILQEAEDMPPKKGSKKAESCPTPARTACGNSLTEWSPTIVQMPQQGQPTRHTAFRRDLIANSRKLTQESRTRVQTLA